jgi:hypothetical protein
MKGKTVTVQAIGRLNKGEVFMSTYAFGMPWKLESVDTKPLLVSQWESLGCVSAGSVGFELVPIWVTAIRASQPTSVSNLQFRPTPFCLRGRTFVRRGLVDRS